MSLKRMLICLGALILMGGMPVAVSAHDFFDVGAVRARVQDLKATKGPVKVYQVCGAHKGKTGGTEYCVSDVFNWTNVQGIQGVQLAKEYARIKNGHNIVCSGKFRTSYNDDYLRCSDGKNHYEFKFDDLTESVDYVIQRDTARAVCQLHGGKIGGSITSCIVSSAYACQQIDTSLKKFGYGAQWVDEMNGYRGCNMFFGAVGANSRLRTAFGIDNRKFEHLQIKSGADLKFLLRRYAQMSVENAGQKLTAFDCNSSFNTYRTGQVVGNRKDDILTCRVNGQPVDFVFDDLNENFDITSTGGTAGLQCIAVHGGVFDGRNCSGLSSKQCDQMDSLVPGGTRWDDLLDTCVLKSAAAADDFQQSIDTATTAGLGVTAVLVTVLTGGSATVVIIGVTGAMVGTAGSMTVRYADIQVQDAIAKSIAQSARCKTADCAWNALLTLISNAAPYQNHLDAQMGRAVNEEIARLITLAAPDSPQFEKLIHTMIHEKVEFYDDLSNYAQWPDAKKERFWGRSMEYLGAVLGVTAGLKASGGLLEYLKSFGDDVRAALMSKVSANTVIRAANSYFTQDAVRTVISGGAVIPQAASTGVNLFNTATTQVTPMY